jgi:hypothetical protein
MQEYSLNIITKKICPIVKKKISVTIRVTA